MKYCSVPQCKAKWAAGVNKKYHQFPNDQTLKKQWIHALKMGRCAPSKFAVVCSDHFKDSDYKMTNYGVWPGRLIKDSVPSQNLPVTSLEKRKRETIQRYLKLGNKENKVDVVQSVEMCQQAMESESEFNRGSPIKSETPNYDYHDPLSDNNLIDTSDNEYICPDNEPHILHSEEIKLEPYQIIGNKINYGEKYHLDSLPVPETDDIIFSENAECKQPLKDIIDITDDGDEDLAVANALNKSSSSLTPVTKMTNKQKQIKCVKDVGESADSAKKMQSLIANLIDNITTPNKIDILADLENEIKKMKSKMLHVSQGTPKIQDKIHNGCDPKANTKNVNGAYVDRKMKVIKKENTPNDSGSKNDEKNNSNSQKNSISNTNDLDVNKDDVDGKCKASKKTIILRRIHPIAKKKRKKDANRADRADQESQGDKRKHINEFEDIDSQRNVTKSNDEVFHCNNCGDKFGGHGGTMQRIQIHHVSIRFMCDFKECTSLFKSREELTKHKLAHKEDRPFICNVCDKSFKRKTHLTIHGRTHLETKQHTCQFCKKSFREKHQLTAHFQVHSDEKPYVCDLCGKAFRQKKGLANHSKMHTGENEKPLYCLPFVKNKSLKDPLHREVVYLPSVQ